MHLQVGRNGRLVKLLVMSNVAALRSTNIGSSGYCLDAYARVHGVALPGGAGDYLSGRDRFGSSCFRANACYHDPSMAF